MTLTNRRTNAKTLGQLELDPVCSSVALEMCRFISEFTLSTNSIISLNLHLLARKHVSQSEISISVTPPSCFLRKIIRIAKLCVGGSRKKIPIPLSVMTLKVTLHIAETNSTAYVLDYSPEYPYQQSKIYFIKTFEISMMAGIAFLCLMR